MPNIKNKFNKSPIEKPSGAKDFISGSNINTDTNTDISINTSTDTSITDILSEYNPNDIRKKSFNLRINQYYMEALRYFSKPDEGVSMQSVLQEIVMKELDKRIKAEVK